jgi:hypothetical protein
MGNAKRDLGKGLGQQKITPGHWVIEGYDVYPWSCWEGTHTSRGAEIRKNGETVVSDAGGISEARQWIRKQISQPTGTDER